LRIETVRLSRNIHTSEGTAMVYRILLVQTDQKVASSIQESLAASSESAFQVEWLQSSSACQSRLRHSNRDAGGEPREAHVDEVDAILLDLFLPDCRGIDTFNRIFSLAAHIPILIIAAPQDELAAKVAVQRGAQDYLLKDRWDAYLLPKVLRNMIERSANMEALYEEKERAEVTLNSIGDAVVSTDTHGQITFLNPVAERLTGWSRDEATGRPLEDVLVMIDSVTRERVSDPMQRAMSENKTVGFTTSPRREPSRRERRISPSTIASRTCPIGCCSTIDWLRPPRSRIAAANSLRFCTSMSIVSRRSTTPWAMPSATGSCNRVHNDSVIASGSRIRSAAKAATSL
jgi:PAS domain S-box-containing protein